ncbi:MAG: riboflavin synthase [Gemmatimonadetes bacterium]|nr:riboflavin synthase [Gemmatimonadota bacterium]
MFTGIIEEVGTVQNSQRRGEGVRLWIQADRVAADVRAGDSVALDGVCQTVVSTEAGTFLVEAIGTTLSRTTLGEFRAGRRVNLERALALGDRLGGHLVQGHVDGVGVVMSLRREAEHVLLDIQVPDVVAEVTVLHGSLAVNGVSLTVNALPAQGVAQVALIPYTWEHTAFPDLQTGDAVNLEGDLIGKFVVAYLKRTGAAGVEATGRAARD